MFPQPGFGRQWQAKSVRHAAEISYVVQLLTKAIRISSSTTALNNGGDFEKTLHCSSSPQAMFLRITIQTSGGYGKNVGCHGIDCAPFHQPSFILALLSLQCMLSPLMSMPNIDSPPHSNSTTFAKSHIRYPHYNCHYNYHWQVKISPNTLTQHL